MFGLIFVLLHSASRYFNNALFRYEHTLKMNNYTAHHKLSRHQNKQ